jgi:hypothetical protein
MLLLCAYLITGFVHGSAAEDEFPVLKGPYLGQEPPGITPRVFAPGVISKDGVSEGGATFSSDGELFIYKRYYRGKPDPEELWLSELEDGKWTRPHRASFDGEHSDWDFNFAPTGRAFYFTSRRPALIDGKEASPSNIWLTERVSSGWTEPRLLEHPVNVIDSYSGYPSLTKDGAIYFHSERADSLGQVDIYRARLKNGKYVKVENVGGPVNTENREFDPCVAPDESYLIFVSNRPSEIGLAYDMYISFRSDDGSWSEPKGLGGILGRAGLPSVTPDGRYFFFKSSAGGESDDPENSDIYWVDTKVFDQLRSKRGK